MTPQNPRTEDMPRRLSDDLQLILDHATAKESLTLGEIVAILRGRGADVLIILLAFPFCTPLPLPGLSVPFGIVLCLFGIRVALRKKPWLPKQLLNRPITQATLQKIVAAALKAAHWIERVLRPRLQFFKQWAPLQVVGGCMMTASALLLALPLPPIPLGNGLPALAIVLIAAGMMEEDGLAIFFGYLLAATSWVYIALVILYGQKGMAMLWQWVGF